MTRTEFLEQLRQALQGNISQAQINEHLRYYENYIIEESRKGRTEQEVIDSLGEPRLIARTLIDAGGHAGKAYNESYYEDVRGESDMHQKGFRMSRNQNGNWDIRYGRFKLNSWYAKLLLVLFLILLIVIVWHVMVVLVPVVLVIIGIGMIVNWIMGK